MSATGRQIEARYTKARKDQERHRLAMEAAHDQATVALAELHALLARQQERFGHRLPLDAFVLDVLEQVDIEPGNVWRWRGMRNNHGTPTVRYPRSKTAPNGREGSAVRLLAIAFGVLSADADEHTILFPAPGHDSDDVNPWHRVIRSTASA